MMSPGVIAEHSGVDARKLEGVRFELTESVNPRQFSRLVP
jgi:hypothetical protein